MSMSQLMIGENYFRNIIILQPNANGQAIVPVPGRHIATWKIDQPYPAIINCKPPVSIRRCDPGLRINGTTNSAADSMLSQRYLFHHPCDGHAFGPKILWVMALGEGDHHWTPVQPTIGAILLQGK